MNSRKQAYCQHYRAKQTYEIFYELLVNDPAKMPHKLIPKIIENEDPDEKEIRKCLAIEKFKTEISLQKLRLQKCRERFSKIDAEMISRLKSNNNDQICIKVINQWELDCKKEEEKSKVIFNKKRDWYLNNAISDCNNNNNLDGINDKSNDKRKEKNSSNSRTNTDNKKNKYINDEGHSNEKKPLLYKIRS